MALWDAKQTNQLYHTKIDARAGDSTRFISCANVHMDVSWDNTYSIKTLIVTNESILALMTIKIDRSIMSSLEGGASSVNRYVSYYFTR